MNILITGGAGYVGFPLSRQLAGRGHRVVVVDNFATTASRIPALERFADIERLDITDRDQCLEAFERIKPDAVIHLAALHFIPECNRRPADAIRINVIGTQNVLDACARVPGLSRVLVTSSAAVYAASDEYMQETATPAPTDVYGGTKAVNEEQARAFARRTGISTAAVRLFNVFGPGETNPHVIPEIVEQLRAGEYTLNLGNVTPKRCYVYVDDVVDGFEALLGARLPGEFATINLGTREEASVEEIVSSLSNLLGTPIRIAVDESRRRPSDRPFLRCDPGLMTSLTGWSARHSTEMGLRELLVAEQLLTVEAQP